MSCPILSVGSDSVYDIMMIYHQFDSSSVRRFASDVFWVLFGRLLLLSFLAILERESQAGALHQAISDWPSNDPAAIKIHYHRAPQKTTVSVKQTNKNRIYWTSSRQD